LPAVPFPPLPDAVYPPVPVIWSPPPEPPQPKTSVKDTNDARHSRFVLASFT